MSRIVSALFGRAAAGVTAKGVAGAIQRANIGIAESVTSTATGPILGGLANVITSEITYAMHRQVTNQVPEASQAIRAFWAGQLSQADTTRILANNNIAFANRRNPGDNFWTFCWDTIIKLEQPKLDPSTIIEKWRVHQLSTDRAFDYLGLHGITRNGDRDTLLSDRGQFDFGLATSLWRQGQIAMGEYLGLAIKHGIGDDRARDLLLTQTSIAPVSDYRDWWLAGWIDDGAYANRLRREEISDPADIQRELRMRTPISPDQTRSDYWMGWTDQQETQRRLSLLGYGTDAERDVTLRSQLPYGLGDALRFWRQGIITQEELYRTAANAGIVDQERFKGWLLGNRPLPGPSDLVSFAVHEVWDADVVNRLQYDAEMPPQYDYWMQAQGWSWGAEGGPLQPSPPGQTDWTTAYWRNHWRPITEQMAHDAWVRLRPDRIGRYQQQVPGVVPFVREDFDRALKILDYSPTNRKWIEAISFQVLPIASARILYRAGKRNRQWLVDQALDRGYVREDAEALVDAEDARLALQAQRQLEAIERKVRQSAIDQIGRGYVLGTVPRDFAVSRLHDLGMEEEVARAWIDSLAAKENLTVVQDGIKALRRAFLAGEFPPNELAVKLSQLGLLPDAIQRYVIRWGLQRTQSRRMFTTGKVQQLVATGYISWQDGLARLVNLGWSNPDALLQISEARHKADELAAKSAKADEMARGKRQRELEKVNKDAQALIKKNQAALARLTPVATLKRLVCEAIVSPQWAGDRLQAMGYDDDTVTLYVKDWAAQNAANKKCKPPLEEAQDTLPKAKTVAPEPPFTGKMTVQPTAATVLPVGKQGNQNGAST